MHGRAAKWLEPEAAKRNPQDMDNESLYQQRLARYVTAMRNEKPDRIPLRRRSCIRRFALRSDHR